MELNLATFYLSLCTIVIVIVLGFSLGKKKLINSGTNKQLVDLLLSVFMPAALFSAFPSEFSGTSANNFFLGLLAGIVVMLAVIIAAQLFFNRKIFKGGLNHEAKFAFIFNNATFLGYPLVSTTFGEEGIIPYCGFIVIFNLALFSYGIFLFERKISWKFFREVITNPNILAVLIGMVLFLLQIHLPSFITNPIQLVATATTPLSLLCIGVMLSRADFKKLLKKWRLFLIAATQLICAPLLTWAALTLISFPTAVIIICTLMQALPTATSLGLFAEKYGGDQTESSELVVISTLMSIVTLPAIVYLLFSGL